MGSSSACDSFARASFARRPAARSSSFHEAKVAAVHTTAETAAPQASPEKKAIEGDEKKESSACPTSVRESAEARDGTSRARDPERPA